MAKKKKAKVKITSRGMLVSFGYNLRTPAVVELYPNQIAILKSNGTEFEILSDPNKGDTSSDSSKLVTMYRGGLVKAKKSAKKVVEVENTSVIADTMKKKPKKSKKPVFESSLVVPNDNQF